MTTIDQPEIDFDSLDSEYRARRDITGNDWSADEDFALFVAALDAATDSAGLISQNRVRTQLVEDTLDGPRCSIEHHRYSAFFARACSSRLIAKAKRTDGRTLKDECRTSFTGNNGKDQIVYVARSLASHADPVTQAADGNRSGSAADADRCPTT